MIVPPQRIYQTTQHDIHPCSIRDQPRIPRTYSRGNTSWLGDLNCDSHVNLMLS